MPKEQFHHLIVHIVFKQKCLFFVQNVIAFLSISQCIVAETLKKEYCLNEEINVSCATKWLIVNEDLNHTQKLQFLHIGLQ
jgi:hypothetical protein